MKVLAKFWFRTFQFGTKDISVARPAISKTRVNVQRTIIAEESFLNPNIRKLDEGKSDVRLCASIQSFDIKGYDRARKWFFA